MLGQYYRKTSPKCKHHLKRVTESRPMPYPPSKRSQRLLCSFFIISIWLEKKSREEAQCFFPLCLIFYLFVPSLVLVCVTLPRAITVTEINTWYSFQPLVTLIAPTTTTTTTTKSICSSHTLCVNFLREKYRELQRTTLDASSTPATTNTCAEAKFQISFQLVDYRVQRILYSFKNSYERNLVS